MAHREWVEGFVRGGLVPALLVVGLLTAGISAGQAYPRARASAYGGFWAGVLAVAALVLALLGRGLGPIPSPVPWVAGAEVAGGAVLGGYTTLGYIWFRDRAWIALPLALQSGGSLAMLYLLLVWPDLGPHIAWVVVGIAPTATLFYTAFRDKPPLPRRSRRRERVRALPPDPGGKPDASS